MPRTLSIPRNTLKALVDVASGKVSHRKGWRFTPAGAKSWGCVPGCAGCKAVKAAREAMEVGA